MVRIRQGIESYILMSTKGMGKTERENPIGN